MRCCSEQIGSPADGPLLVPVDPSYLTPTLLEGMPFGAPGEVLRDSDHRRADRNTAWDSERKHRDEGGCHVGGRKTWIAQPGQEAAVVQLQRAEPHAELNSHRGARNDRCAAQDLPPMPAELASDTTRCPSCCTDRHWSEGDSYGRKGQAGKRRTPRMSPPAAASAHGPHPGHQIPPWPP